MFEFLKHVSWKNHLGSLSRFFAALLFLLATIYFYVMSQSDLLDARVSYDQNRYNYDEAEDQKAILAENMMQFKSFQTKGYIGTPNRLQWLEVIRELGLSHDITDINFSLERLEKLKQYEDPYWNHDIAIESAEMRVLLKAAHEGKLFSFLKQLETQALGLFSIEDCNIQWSDSTSADMILSRLSADCQLKWYILEDVTQSWTES